MNPVWSVGIIICGFSYYYSYRIKLLDRNETVLLHLSVGLAHLLKIKMFTNFEYLIYRARLSYIELDRLNINYAVLIEVLIAIEDMQFRNHRGINFRSIARATLSQIPYIRQKWNILRSGGSTLEMQLSRTIFIPTDQNKFKRKLLEIFFSRWINDVLTKEETSKIYIASVRYGYGVMGLAAALKTLF
jgi:penicillin-binding protein 1A